MMPLMDSDSAVAFPVSDPATGARSSAAFAQSVIADALGSTPDAAAVPTGAAWRSDYPSAFRSLVTAGLESPTAAVDAARRGLAAVHSRMSIDLTSSGALASELIVGSARPTRRVRIPYGGQLLTGADIDRQLDDWLAHDVIEPSCAEAVRTVAAHPDWLDLSDLTFAILGAGAQMGPVSSLLSWGAEVIAVDLPRPAIWERLRSVAAGSSGRLHAVPADVTASPGSVADHLAERDLRGRSLVLGNYVYAPGSAHVLVSAAVDAVTAQTVKRRDGTTLSFLGTPTDVYAVPDAVVDAAERAYARSGPMRAARPVLRGLSRGRLAQRHYPPSSEASLAPGITDSLVLQQGPNYAFAKRIQRWRATAARADGVPVSFTVAPPSRTTSVTSNRLLRAAYDGAHRFGVSIFDPETSNALMATLLIHDLRNPREHNHPWQYEADAAAHGGLWRQGYVPRSVLGLAVGVGARSLVGRSR
ncbi:MAG: hypothetical protein JWN61_2088 [Pseudonocardiales bacterium]|nr:hypothetical protein [Pseudonocardiales bacterium]